jgi:hypothetical protein
MQNSDLDRLEAELIELNRASIATVEKLAVPDDARAEMLVDLVWRNMERVAQDCRREGGND